LAGYVIEDVFNVSEGIVLMSCLTIRSTPPVNMCLMQGRKEGCIGEQYCGINLVKFRRDFVFVSFGE